MRYELKKKNFSSCLQRYDGKTMILMVEYTKVEGLVFDKGEL
jgi:hypothetical protein